MLLRELEKHLLFVVVKSFLIYPVLVSVDRDGCFVFLYTKRRESYRNVIYFAAYIVPPPRRTRRQSTEATVYSSGVVEVVIVVVLFHNRAENTKTMEVYGRQGNEGMPSSLETFGCVCLVALDRMPYSGVLYCRSFSFTYHLFIYLRKYYFDRKSLRIFVLVGFLGHFVEGGFLYY